MGVERNELVDVFMLVHMPNIPLRIGSAYREGSVRTPFCFCGANPLTEKLTDKCSPVSGSLKD